MAESSPSVIVLAGPNGAGKTTVARTLLAETLKVMMFVNANGIGCLIRLFFHLLHPVALLHAARRVIRIKDVVYVGSESASGLLQPFCSEPPGLSRRAKLAGSLQKNCNGPRGKL